VGATVADSRSMTALLPIMGVVLALFWSSVSRCRCCPCMCIRVWGLSTFVVGLVTGSQFAASLVSRVWSGHYADSKGPKRAVVVGLLTAVAGGLLYLLSLGFVGTPPVGEVQIPVAKRAMMTIVAICMTPCSATARK
jgi:MFS family permease